MAAVVVLAPTPAQAEPTPPGHARGLPSVTTLPAPAAGQPTKVAYANDHVLVRFRTGTSASAQAHALSAAGTSADTALRGGYVSVAAPKGASAQLASLRTSPAVAWAGYDYVRHAQTTPNDPGYVNVFQTYLKDINMPAAWSISRGSLSQVVAVVDTGVDATHPDLAGRVLPGDDLVNHDTNAADDNGHGTMVAGIAAANTNNGVGVAGVAWTARILPVKVLDSSGSGLDSTIANGIRWAADNGATVINLSLGGPGASPALHDAITYAVSKNIPVVAAAGNTGDDTVMYPAADPAAIAVSAESADGGLASFSTFGDWVDVAAPGVGITSTYPGNSYATGAGTSFASPIVAGVVALVRTQNPGWTPAQVAARIEGSAMEWGAPATDQFFGHGLVDAAAALGAPRSATNEDLADLAEPDVAQAAATLDAPTHSVTTGDVDWFQTPTAPVAGDGWTFTVHPIAPAASLAEWMDPQLSVYDSTFHLLGTSTTQINQAGDVQVSVLARGGPVFMQVSNLNPGRSLYSLTAAANGTTGTPTAAGPRAWLVDSTPRPRSYDVDTSTALTLTLGRSMDATSLTSATVQLRDMAGTPVAGSVSYSAGTGVLTFTPDAPLLVAMSYDLVVAGATDSVGNPMPRTDVSFVTVDGAVRPVTGLAASGGSGTVALSWTQPVVQQYLGATLRYAVGDVAPAWGSGTVAASGYLDGATVSGLDSTKDYSFAVFTQRLRGGPMGVTTTTVHGSSDLLTVTPSPSVYVKAVTITATLRDTGTLAPEPNRSAALYWRRTGTTAWTLIKVTQTDASGQVTAVSTPPWNAQYYLHDLGGLGRMGGAVTVDHAVTFDVSSRQTATTVVHGATVTLTGVVLPARPGTSVLLENYYGGAWHLTATGTLNANSAHAFPVTLRSAATYSFRFVKAGDTLLGTGVSPTFSVTVT